MVSDVNKEAELLVFYLVVTTFYIFYHYTLINIKKVSCAWSGARPSLQLSTDVEGEAGKKSAERGQQVEVPEEPTDCCMSGCANCVWIAYAEQLSELFRDGGQRARDTIMSKVTDPSMRMFLLMELKAQEEERNS